MTRRLLPLLIASLALAGLGGFVSLDSETATAATTAPANAAAARGKLGPLTKAERLLTLARLATLKTAPESSMAGYERDLFSHWRDPDHNGCDAREDALIAYGRLVQTGERCRVLAGSWYDPYGGVTYTNPRQLDVDHIVPLAAAWRSGASRWTEARRDAFANDQKVLLPVYLSLNRQKGDKGPEAWHPPLRSFWPRYAALWVQTKMSYGLSITPSECQKLKLMLASSQ